MTTPIKFSVKLKNDDVLYGLNWKCEQNLKDSLHFFHVKLHYMYTQF